MKFDADSSPEAFLSDHEKCPEVLLAIQKARQRDIDNGLYAPRQTYETHPHPAGIMRTRKGNNRPVERTERNDLFFTYDSSICNFRLAYQNSAIVVSTLQLLLESAREGGNKARTCAFFDVKGNFYENARPTNLSISNTDPTIKHTISFDVPDPSGKVSSIGFAVDDIYCISGTQIVPLQWEGDDN